MSHTRLGAAFRNGPALIVYLMGGDPSPREFLQYARAAIRGGADVLEIGVPFSDPVADGPTIQQAGLRALEAGTTPVKVLEMARTLAGESSTPLVLMTYYNPVYRRGVRKFAADAAGSGVCGVILPDVPFEESEDIAGTFAHQGVDLVQLASPATPGERLDRIAEATRGFLYLVSSYGVTGARGEIPEETRNLVAETKKRLDGKRPFAVGFGVSTPEQARALVDAGADGVIVGSALVKLVEERRPPSELEDAVRALKRGLRG